MYILIGNMREQRKINFQILVDDPRKHELESGSQQKNSREIIFMYAAGFLPLCSLCRYKGSITIASVTTKKVFETSGPSSPGLG